MRFLLTESGLEAVGGVVADAIPAVEVERANATCDVGGGGGCQGCRKKWRPRGCASRARILLALVSWKTDD